MRSLSVAFGLIQHADTYPLQLREGSPEIGAVNLLGCFGGKIEVNETAVQAVSRELAEETTLVSDPEDWEYLGDIEVISDHKLEQVKILGEVFKIVVDQSQKIQAKEGKLVCITKAEAMQQLDKMTPGTKKVFERFVIGDI